jgi:hypothetical protein
MHRLPSVCKKFSRPARSPFGRVGFSQTVTASKLRDAGRKRGGKIGIKAVLTFTMVKVFDEQNHNVNE